MSDNALPIKATLKAGTGYDAPWVTVDAADPNDLAFKLNALTNGDALQAVVEAANALKGANNAAPLVAGGAEAAPAPQAPVQPQGWGNSAPAAAPAWSGAQQQAPQQPQNNGARLHPEGIQCPVDGNVVQFKEIVSKKNGKTFQMWTCPNQRNRDDGHYSQFAN
jgi:hypothetical protein